MNPLQHVMILASAGSGKTYALTNRFVELLARGASPERIVALTFTRKAAGEFFDEILNKLARAASDPQAAAQLARDIDAPQLRSPDFLRFLRAVTDAMHRLRLGTLDGFFARIARVFPFELGLTGEFELLEDHAARMERQRVLRRMFTRAGGELGAAQQEFIEAFKRATFGAEEKRLGPRLDEFLDAHQERYLEAPEASLWGEHRRIWPDGNAWIENNADRIEATGRLRGWMEGAGIGDKQRVRWEAFLAAAEAWAPGMAPVDPLAYVLKKVVASWPEVVAGRAVLEFDRRKQVLDAGGSAALADLTRYIVGGELQRRLATTRGIHAVLRGYETVYQDEVRRAGKLTFGDVQRLLVPSGGAGALSGEAAQERRLFVDYRLDAGIDHWLLDEFQDTSHGQWSVLRNLIDEIVQDTAGTRSFFCVGDVKQAIFAWREGDPRLFREIFEHYNSAAPGTVVARHLVESWRSGPPLIEMVNAVFGAAAVIQGLFPGPAAVAWNSEWRAHVSAVPQRTGQAALLLAEDEADRWQRVVRLLHEILPLERGLTCAVLVTKNSTATQLADYIRREGKVPALAESDLHVCTDNPLGAALLALAQAAAHPGDTLAWEHVQMTPLGAVLADEGVVTREIAVERLLGQVHAGGFERTMEEWLRKLERRLGADDGFSRVRARQFAAAAARFDKTGSRDVAEFIAFMERHVVREPESAAVVRVMTIHKSKGLGFDVVILPDLEGKRIDERRGGLAVQKTSAREVEWVLDLPPKLICQADDVLSRHVRGAEADACYESLSVLYVALTRAKRALYAIVEPVGKSVSRNYPRLLVETLGDNPGVARVGALELPAVWSSGDATWHRTVAAPAERTPGFNDAAVILASIERGAAEPAIRREARRPSARTDGRIPASFVFSLESSSGADFGAEVHALLAQVEWIDQAALAACRDTWRARSVREDVIREVMSCLEAGALADLWKVRPRTEVWRERSFEIVLNNAWVTGVFDRVMVERDASGRAVHATVFDFKTEPVADEAACAAAVANYAPQLNVYRQVAGVLTGLRPAGVRCELIFTRARKRVVVPLQTLRQSSE
jgi:ATP-dependent helicase/nuclease subunit A